MSTKLNRDVDERLKALKNLLAEGANSTQEELVEALRKKNFAATQSTISRDLNRLHAIKARDSSGRVMYRLPEDPSAAAPLPAPDLKGLIDNIQHNGYLIVIRTAAGSASLVARILDQTKPEGLLGTIAGDDTIFVAPSSTKKIKETIKAILEEFR